MAEYTVGALEDEGVEALIRHERIPGGLRSEEMYYEDAGYPEVFRAATSILAPDDEVRELIARAIWQAQDAPNERSWEMFRAGYFRRAESVLGELATYAIDGESIG